LSDKDVEHAVTSEVVRKFTGDELIVNSKYSAIFINDIVSE